MTSSWNELKSINKFQYESTGNIKFAQVIGRIINFDAVVNNCSILWVMNNSGMTTSSGCFFFFFFFFFFLLDQGFLTLTIITSSLLGVSYTRQLKVKENNNNKNENKKENRKQTKPKILCFFICFICLLLLLLFQRNFCLF